MEGRGRNIGLLEQKTYAFALRIVKAYQFLTKEHNEFVLSKQLLRSGTSIGANCKEAVYAQSTPDFIGKLSIALKEAAETDYWIDLLHSSELIEDRSFLSIKQDCIEIIKLLTAIIKTTKNTLNNKY